MTNLIIAQILGFIALILICLSYFFSSKKTFLIFQLSGNIFYASSFLVLNVLVGGITTMISMVRCIILFLYERKDKTPPIYIYIVLFLSYLIASILLYQTTYDIIAMITCQMFNLAMFVKNINWVRFLMLPPNLMIIAYNIICKTYTNAILDCIESVVLIVSIITHAVIKKNKEKKIANSSIKNNIDSKQTNMDTKDNTTKSATNDTPITPVEDFENDISNNIEEELEDKINLSVR